MDRYYYTLLAYHYNEYLSLPNGMQNIYNFLLQPDLIFFIDIDFSSIKERIFNRGLLSDDDLFMQENKYTEVINAYQKVLPKNTIRIYNADFIKTMQKIKKHLENESILGN